MTVKAAGRTSTGKSGFGGSIPEIGGNTGAVSDSIKDTIMEKRYIDNDDPDLGKVSILRDAPKAIGKSIEIWADVLLASRP